MDDSIDEQPIRTIAIPLKESTEDEVIEISCADLPTGLEVLNILEAEEAKLSFWIEVALEYYRQGRVEPFMMILEAAGSRAGLEYQGVKQDQMRALDILAAYWMTQGYKEKAKEKKADFFSKATVLFNTADKIAMYEWSHLTVRAWFYLFEREKSTNKYDLADQQFNYVVKTYPQNVLSLVGKAVIAFNKKDYKTSVYYYRKAIRQRRDSIADLRVGIGYCYAKMGLTDKAKVAFERALEIEHTNVSAMCGLAIISLNTLDPLSFKTAITLFGKAYNMQPDHPVVLVHLANHFFFKGDAERASTLAWHAVQYTECDAIKAEGYFQLGRAKHVSGAFDQAYKFYYQARQANNGEHTLAHYGLGQMLINRNEIDEAIKCFEIVHQRLPNNTDTMKILGSLYAHVQLNDETSTNEARQKGREVLAKYLAIHSDDYEASIDLAQLLESSDPKTSLELYEKAIELLETIENIQPQPEMLNNVGALYMSMKDYDRAEDYFKRAKERLEEQLTTTDAQLLARRNAPERSHLLTIRYNLARCLEHLCRTAEAEQMYKDIVTECPDYIDGYLRLGCITRDRHQVYESSLWLKNGVQFDQSSPVVWTLIGNLHFAKNEWMPAQKKFEFILSKIYNNKTPDPYSLVALGNVWFEQLLNPSRKKEDEKKYIERALQMYQKALKLQPKNMYAANGIGCVLAYKKNWNDARDVFAQVRESTSDFYDVWLNIAHVCMEREQWMTAVQMYSSAMKKFRKENDPNLLHFLAKAFYRAGMLKEAKEVLEKAMLEQLDNTQLKFNYAIVMKKAAKEVLRGTKMTSQQVKAAIGDLTFAEKIFKYISKNDDKHSSSNGLRISRTLCSEEASSCKDLLTQAQHKLTAAQSQDDEEQRLIKKQEEELVALKDRMMKEAREKEDKERLKQESMKNLRLSFIDMTKDILKLPEIVEEKRRGTGGRKRKNEDGDEFVNDSSDAGNWDGEEVGEDGERRERKKKDKAAKKASRRKRERRDSGGSDVDRKAEKKQRRKEEKERKQQEKLSAKQSSKIKSRAFLSSSESSDDDKPKPAAAASSDDEDDIRPPVDDFDSPPNQTDSDADSDREATKKKKKKAVVVDSDEESGSGSEKPIIGASDDEDPAPARGGNSSDDNQSDRSGGAANKTNDNDDEDSD